MPPSTGGMQVEPSSTLWKNKEWSGCKAVCGYQKNRTENIPN